jgi:hypothetical protein
MEKGLAPVRPLYSVLLPTPKEIQSTRTTLLCQLPDQIRRQRKAPCVRQIIISSELKNKKKKKKKKKKMNSPQLPWEE